MGLITIDRDEVFTAPDVTGNDLQMFSMHDSYFISGNIQLAETLFRRENDADSFNGDGYEFKLCEYFDGEQSLFRKIDRIFKRR